MKKRRRSLAQAETNDQWKEMCEHKIWKCMDLKNTNEEFAKAGVVLQ